MPSTAGWGGNAWGSVGGRGSVESWWDNLSFCFSPLSNVLFIYSHRAEITTDNNSQAFSNICILYTIPCWLNVPPIALNTASSLPLCFDSCCTQIHTETHAGVCTYPSRDAEKQLNRKGANKMEKKPQNNLSWHATYMLVYAFLPLASISAIRASCVVSSRGTMKRCFKRGYEWSKAVLSEDMQREVPQVF